MTKTLHLKLLAVYKVECHRRILQPFSIIKAKYTRAVGTKTLHLKLLAMYKAESHRRILQPFGIIEAE